MVDAIRTVINLQVEVLAVEENAAHQCWNCCTFAVLKKCRSGRLSAASDHHSEDESSARKQPLWSVQPEPPPLSHSHI